MNAVLRETMDALGLTDAVIELGLAFDIGSGAKRLSLAQQQKLALGRALVKRPDLLIVNRALAALDAQRAGCDGHARARLFARRRRPALRGLLGAEPSRRRAMVRPGADIRERARSRIRRCATKTAEEDTRAGAREIATAVGDAGRDRG